MARKPVHFTEHTAEEMREMFSSAIGALGMRTADPGRDNRIHAVLIDGVALGARKRELRKPGSVYYAQSYLEARATAGMLVDLEIADEVKNVVRGDAPDITVHFRDGTMVFVEQAMIMDSAATRFSLAVDDANILAEAAANSDARLRALFDSGLLTVHLDLTDKDLELRFKPEVLAAEIIGVAHTIVAETALQAVDPERFPVLGRLGARMHYKPCSAQTARPIQLPAYHGRANMLEPALREVVKKKIEKANGYPPSCAPLWLLLDIDHHFDAHDTWRLIANRVVGDVLQSRFDRIVVQHPSDSPLTFGQRT
jgi:hypothetical protein